MQLVVLAGLTLHWIRVSFLLLLLDCAPGWLDGFSRSSFLRLGSFSLVSLAAGTGLGSFSRLKQRLSDADREDSPSPVPFARSRNFRGAAGGGSRLADDYRGQAFAAQ